MAREKMGSWKAALALALAATLFGGSAGAQPKAAPKKPGAGAVKKGAAPAAKSLSETLTGMAKAEYEAGKVLFADKDYDNAIIKFQRAYELSSDPRLLWNVAVCQKNLRRYSRMLATLHKLLADGGPLLSAQDRADADELARTVASFVSPMRITVNEPGADVFLDDEKAGTSPLDETVMVDVGTRKIRVTKPGFRPSETTREVAGGGAEVAVAVTLQREIHQGRMVVVAGPNDLISLDGKAVGKQRWEGTVQSGGHTLRVTAPEMAAYQSEVVIQDDKQRRIDVTLNPLAKSDTARWLWVAGGVVLAAGAVVGAAFLFKPAEAQQVQGSIDPGTVQLSFGGRR